MVYYKDMNFLEGGEYVEIGEKIKAARIAKGMTQEELGQILGVQKSAVAKYESGRIVNIKRSTLKKISDILGIPPFELVFDEEHRKMQKKNDAISDIIVRMRSDSDFLSIVKALNRLDVEQLSVAKPMLSAFLKQFED